MYFEIFTGYKSGAGPSPKFVFQYALTDGLIVSFKI